MRLNPFGGGGMALNGLSDQELMLLSAHTGVPVELLKAQQRAEMASAGSSGGVDGETLIPTVELKLVQNANNPVKARRKNIKMLRKALRPPNYNLGLFKIYRYNAAHECACCGVDVRRFLEGDNAYSHIVDERTGLSLADTYWFDEDTGQARKPHARTHGDHGDEMSSTLCPAHLHIYHTLKCILDEHDLEREGFGKFVSKGTRFLRVPGFSASKAKNRSTPESLAKYAPFFQMIQKDAQYSKGVTLTQHPNPVTGVADLVTVTFDMRAMQLEQMTNQQQAMVEMAAQQPQQIIPQEGMIQ
tara:strand:+ start:1602 stop:2504 length:903 start_codon:yes stop_codon:yes gene_type:complete